jgi:hypothetical protein
MPGAVLAFGELGRAVLTGRPFSVHGELIEAARSGMAAAQADAVLAEARASDPRVEAFLQAAEAPRAPHVHDLPEGWHAFGWVDFQKVIERRVREGDRIPFFVGRWGERAPELELAKAAEALVDLPKGDVGLLRGYLGVFNKRPFPLDPAPLVALVGDRRRFVAGFAIGALKRVSHPAVRELALRMAARGPHRASSLGLLAHNWERGDEEFAEGLLRSTARHRQAIHTLCYGLRDVVEARPSAPELVPAIRLAYEVQPCSICREDIVSALLSLGALPDDLRAECRWDAHEGTRRLVSPET